MNSGVKRSLFNKPTWAAKATSANNAGGDVFRHNVVYQDILKEEEAKRERKATKTKQRAEKEKSPGKSREENRDTKRRRLSEEDDDPSIAGIDSDSDAASRSSKASTPAPQVQLKRPVTRSTPKKESAAGDLAFIPAAGSPRARRKGADRAGSAELEKASISATRSHPQVVAKKSINVPDDEDLVEVPAPTAKNTTSSKRKSDQQTAQDDSDEEDPYIRELKRKARETASVVGTQSTRAQSTDTTAALPPPSPLSTPAASPGRATQSPARTPARAAQDDPIIKILIQSSIPNTRPLIVQRRASQRLKDVKDFWCGRYELDPDLAQQVILTWRGNQLFDSTTMEGIIKNLKRSHVRRAGSSFGDGDGDDYEDPSHGRILLHAVTRKEHARLQAEKERQLEAEADRDQDNDDDNDEEAAAEQAEPEPEVQQKPGLVLQLASETAEMSLRVRPDTKIGKIMMAFAKTHQVEEGKTCWLQFDGERLDPEDTVDSVGLEHGDQVEVLVR